MEAVMLKKSTAVFAVTTILSLIVPFSATRAAIMEGATAALVINQLHDRFSDLIDKARDSGDFLTWRVAITGRDLIDAFQKSNVEVINVAFDKLDKQKQDVLRGIDANLDKLISQKNMTLDAAESISAEWSQIISTTYVASSRPYVMNYKPRVVVPEGEQTINLQVIGPNMGRAGALIKNGPFSKIKPTTPLDQTAVFNLKRSNFSFPETESQILRLDVAYKVPKYLIFNDTATNNIELWLLPSRLAHYKLTTKVQTTTRENVTRIVNLGQFKGRNSRIPRAVLVPDSALGWRLDLTRRSEIRLVQGGADKGRCEGIEEQSITENGLTMFARVDNRDRPFNRRDAWTDCSSSLPLYRTSKSETDGIGADGDLSWTKDVVVRLPPDLVSMNIQLDLFDKRSRSFTGSGSDKYVDVRKEGDQLLLKPVPPRDF